MAATVSSASPYGRIAVFGNRSEINVTVSGAGATYATASGGLPFDLAGALNEGLVNDQPYLNPGDIVPGSVEGQVSTPGKYLPSDFAIGTSTFTTGSGSGYGSQSGLPAPMSVQPYYTGVATCPCTIRLWNGTTEFSDGACSEIFNLTVVIARGGVNA